MELQPKTEPGSCSNDEMKLENMSIHDLVSVLRAAYRTEQYDRVEEILVSRDKKLKTEIQRLQDKFEMERQARLQAEEDLKKREELCERGKMAQKNSELEKSLKNICEAQVDAGIAAFEIDNETVEPAPLQTIEPPMKRSKGDQGASSGMKIMYTCLIVSMLLYK